MKYTIDSQKTNKNSNEVLALIFQYFERISAEQDVEVVLSILADLGRELVDAERCTVWLLDKNKKIIFTKVAHGVDQLTVLQGEGIVGYSIHTGEELIINDPYNDSRFSKSKDLETGFVTREILVIPIKGGDGEVIGAFQALNKVSGACLFTKDDLARLRLVASYSGKSIENAQLITETKETQKEIVELLGQAAEIHSLETGNHIRRVSNYSRILAEALGMPQKDIDTLVLASPMHDIGKIGISDTILTKPARLTPEEYEIMKTHAEIGYNILKNSKRALIKAAAIVAYEHHEKYNGTGYPRGLKGEEIHIFGRITAVCDVFDALSSKRVYKDPWKPDEIFDYIKEEKGKHFDPKLVDLFFMALPEMMEIFELYKD